MRNLFFLVILFAVAVLRIQSVDPHELAPTPIDDADLDQIEDEVEDGVTGEDVHYGEEEEEVLGGKLPGAPHGQVSLKVSLKGLSFGSEF